MPYPTTAKRKAALERLRRICLALPETSERLSHGAPSFFVREKKCFLMLLDDHHGDGRFAIWCAAPPGNQELLIAANIDRFFRPPYVGHRGWLGVLLNDGVDWDELEGIARTRSRPSHRRACYRASAPPETAFQPASGASIADLVKHAPRRAATGDQPSSGVGT